MLLTVPRSPGPTNQVFTCARSVAERQVRGGQEVLKRCDTARAGQQQALCQFIRVLACAMQLLSRKYL